MSTLVYFSGTSISLIGESLSGHHRSGHVDSSGLESLYNPLALSALTILASSHHQAFSLANASS
jgi:hypothetical protein